MPVLPGGDITKNWWVVFATLITLLPWAIVSVWDAIDKSYRTRQSVVFRLLLSTLCLVVAYTAGLMFTITLMHQEMDRPGADRHDEIAAVLVLLVFNLWHVARNLRGWLQFLALNNLKLYFKRVQRNFGESIRSDATLDDPKSKPFQAGLSQLLISNRLVDNDWGQGTPYLNPFINMAKLNCNPQAKERWSTLLWRAWWTQDTIIGPRRKGVLGANLDVPNDFEVDDKHRWINVQGLLDTEPSASLTKEGYRSAAGKLVMDQDKNVEIKTKEQWAECLVTYGSLEGQQDTHGDDLVHKVDITDISAIAILINEKRDRIPSRMTALWYDTACFEELYACKARECSESSKYGKTVFPSWSQWLHIAQDVAVNLERPLYLSDTQLTSYAGELASASLILVRYPKKFRKLVQQMYEDGLNARWTFGWSGLLACFSHLWTEERIFMAMLNGLSLLALNSVVDVTKLDANVRSMLCGYAAFEVSDRAVGKQIAEDRKEELLRRYLKNKGKTCRGSGVSATRLACQCLGLPAEASRMDGLPAFTTGWASEYMGRLPGNQTPSHGATHEEVEAKHGSTNAMRYPYSRS